MFRILHFFAIYLLLQVAIASPSHTRSIEQDLKDEFISLKKLFLGIETILKKLAENEIIYEQNADNAFNEGLIANKGNLQWLGKLVQDKIDEAKAGGVDVTDCSEKFEDGIKNAADQHHSNVDNAINNFSEEQRNAIYNLNDDVNKYAKDFDDLKSQAEKCQKGDDACFSGISTSVKKITATLNSEIKNQIQNVNEQMKIKGGQLESQVRDLNTDALQSFQDVYQSFLDCVRNK